MSEPSRRRSSINVDADCGGYTVDLRCISRIATIVARELGVAGQLLGISFVDAKEIRRLNLEFRGYDKTTDVLSFPQQEFAKPLRVGPPATAAAKGAKNKTTTKKTAAAKQARHAVPPEALGDVVISLADAAGNASSIGQGLDRETCFLIVHGILHLCGHDHLEPKEERVMLAQQKKLMALLDLPVGRPAWRGCVSSSTGAL